MKNYNDTDSELDSVFNSLNNKIYIPEDERDEIHKKLNMNLDKRLSPPFQSRRFPFKYYMALSAVGILLLFLVIPMLPMSTDLPSESPAAYEEVLKVLKEDVNIGQSKDEIVDILGNDYTIVLGAETDEKKWRYDIDTINGYTFTEEYDFADMEGLLKGRLKMHIWISWDEENKVNFISALYVHKEGGVVYNYQVFPDGTVREAPLN